MARECIRLTVPRPSGDRKGSRREEQRWAFRKLLSFDPERGGSAEWPFTYMYILHTSQGWPGPAPGDQLIQLLRWALCFYVNAAIRQVFHPSGKAEPLGLDHGVFPVHYALYATDYPDTAMHLFHRCRRSHLSG